MCVCVCEVLAGQSAVAPTWRRSSAGWLWLAQLDGCRLGQQKLKDESSVRQRETRPLIVEGMASSIANLHTFPLDDDEPVMSGQQCACHRAPAHRLRKQCLLNPPIDCASIHYPLLAYLW
ncbi:unnamed protein product [Toxocara canis]|uniref:Secreted protein n=1 Tax=Toxocara canis TaxID=6265 RepID=A0A183V8K9_TOXCA|nr:unnamed protein product [Toxocara canis]